MSSSPVNFPSKEQIQHFLLTSNLLYKEVLRDCGVITAVANIFGGKAPTRKEVRLDIKKKIEEFGEVKSVGAEVRIKMRVHLNLALIDCANDYFSRVRDRSPVKEMSMTSSPVYSPLDFKRSPLFKGNSMTSSPVPFSLEDTVTSESVQPSMAYPVDDKDRKIITETPQVKS